MHANRCDPRADTSLVACGDAETVAIEWSIRHQLRIKLRVCSLLLYLVFSVEISVPSDENRSSHSGGAK